MRGCHGRQASPVGVVVGAPLQRESCHAFQPQMRSSTMALGSQMNRERRRRRGREEGAGSERQVLGPPLHSHVEQDTQDPGATS